MQASKRQDAPGELELVREFVNTRDLEIQTEALASPEDLDRWLREHDLLTQTAQCGRLADALELREALRQLALANSGIPLDQSAVRVLDRACERARVELRFLPNGTSSLQPQATGIHEALGRLLIIVNRSMADGTWRRLRVCPSEDCLWAFYDHSKNGLGRWCQMAECGNRAKVRNYRQRHRQTQQPHQPLVT
jgi:predicted RNA-binding Zn ribbon-like protein